MGALGWDSSNDLQSSSSGVVGSFSSGGCCDNGVDTAAWLALLVGKICIRGVNKTIGANQNYSTNTQKYPNTDL